MNRHEEGVSANGDASNESAAGSQSTSNVIGRIHITTSNTRSGIGGPGSNQPSSLSSLIQFRTQRNPNRRRCTYLNLNGRNANPPAILQRLLGPVAQNVNIGLGQVIANANGSASFRDATRVVVMDNGFGILSNSGEPSIDLVDQAGYLFGRSLAATLNQTPSPLHWWLEEAKALGIESQADVCLTVCNELIPELEAQRSMELSKTRSKRKKKSPSDSNAKQSSNQKQKSSTANQSTNNAEVVSALADDVATATSEAPSHDNENEENQQNSEVPSGSDVEDESGTYTISEINTNNIFIFSNIAFSLFITDISHNPLQHLLIQIFSLFDFIFIQTMTIHRKMTTNWILKIKIWPKTESLLMMRMMIQMITKMKVKYFFQLKNENVF